MIDRFEGDYAFLSNFWKEPVTLKGKTFPTAEHAFVACKAVGPRWVEMVLACATPAEAKHLGRKVELRPGWEEIKLRVMQAVIQAKFAPTTTLSHRLMLTGSQQLIEGNTWGDKFWGCVLEPGPKDGTWVGRNELGRILMEQRRLLQHEIPFGPVDSSATAGATT